MKRFFIILLACALLLGFAPGAWAAVQIPKYNDIADLSPSAQNAIMKLAVLDVLQGNEGLGGSFYPNNTLTRAEFAKIVCYLTGIVSNALQMENVGSKFSDVIAGQWYTGYVNACVASGYYSGADGDTFRPNAQITMYEVAATALRCIGYDDNLGSGTGNTAWPNNYITKAMSVGILDNVNFVASAPATRAQVALICAAVLDLGLVAWVDTSMAWVDGIDPDGFAEIYYLNAARLKCNETILHKVFECYSAERVLSAPVKMAAIYYISGGFILADLPGKKAAIIYNDEDELMFVDVLGDRVASNPVTPDLPDSSTTSYTVTFNANGGSTVASQTVAVDSKVQRPADPKREGYTFDRWYSDAALTSAYDFSTNVTATLTLYAKWTQIATPNIPQPITPTTPITPVMPVNPFSDVYGTNWFIDDVIYAHSIGLIDGKTATTFAPNDNLTYAEAVKLAACMHQFCTKGTVTLTSGNPWYQSYVDYAKANGIISKDYDWNTPATRAGYMEIFAHALLDESFAAKNTIADGAIPDVPLTHPQVAAIYKLYRAGIVQGVDAAHNCNPYFNIKRSEVAAILTRMMRAETRIGFTM